MTEQEAKKKANQEAANQAGIGYATDIFTNLEEIQKHIQDNYHPDRLDWGDVADLGHCASKLEEIIQFLGI